MSANDNLTASLLVIATNSQMREIRANCVSRLKWPVFAAAFSVALLPCDVTSHESRTSRSADPNTYLSGVMDELTKAWPHNRRITIVCHGHSVPAGYFAGREVRLLDAYPHLTHVDIRRLYPTSVTSVICTGVGGENSEQGAARFRQDVLDKRPDVVTIDYALNDRHLGLERARRAWASMIDQAMEAEVKILLLTPTPDTSTPALRESNDPLAQHAQQVRDLAATYRVGLVDSFAAFQRYFHKNQSVDDLMSQSNHPNRRGHEIVAEQLIRWFDPAESSSR